MIYRNSVFNFTNDALCDMENESKFQISIRGYEIWLLDIAFLFFECVYLWVFLYRNLFFQDEIIQRLRGRKPVNKDEEEVEEMRQRHEDVQRSLQDLEKKKEELLETNAKLEAEIAAAEERLAKKRAEELLEVEVDLGLSPSSEGSKFVSNYYADLDAELRMPSYPAAFLEGLVPNPLLERSESEDSAEEFE